MSFGHFEVVMPEVRFSLFTNAQSGNLQDVEGYMNTKTFVLPVLALCFFPPPPQVLAGPLLGSSLINYSVVAGGYVVYGDSSSSSGPVGAVTYITPGAGSSSDGNFINTADVHSALGELAIARSAISGMGSGTALPATMSGSVTLAPGVYSASVLTTVAGTELKLDGGGADNPYWVFNLDSFVSTGASTIMSIFNAGPKASVVWNTGGYVSMGASTVFLGTILSNEYITAGANSTLIGNAFSNSYVTLGADVTITSSNIPASGTWAGSLGGMASSLSIVDGVVVAVPEPGAMVNVVLGLGLLSLMCLRRGFRVRQSAHWRPHARP